MELEGLAQYLLLSVYLNQLDLVDSAVSRGDNEYAVEISAIPNLVTKRIYVDFGIGIVGIRSYSTLPIAWTAVRYSEIFQLDFIWSIKSVQDS
ncbi:hypothetical protein BCON_0092g00390 [Botryotinia convoluta]|uniref:Uncharacterized protein n=1 Tax=Botryotinia convoluta TaxID=54673 RepID=A0A4Z1I2C6_9HELO|nr:hypothetical protein BCON_0092g00390 [Botryotinia convoluta]